MTSKKDIETLIDKNQRRLQKLREQKATFGSQTSPEILTEIEDIEREVGKLKNMLVGTEEGTPRDGRAIRYDNTSLPGSEWDYDGGLRSLEQCLSKINPKLLSEFTVFEARFEENEKSGRLFGQSESTRRERAQIINGLNDLAMKHCGISFNDLCRGFQTKI